MMKLKILNMKEFLKTVNECTGAVRIIHLDGSKEDINNQYGIQMKLRERYAENGNCLTLTLDHLSPKDYLRIVMYYIGDC